MGSGSTPPSKKKLDHFPYKDFHRFSWEICASILITRLWLKGFFKWTAGSTRTQEAKWRCYHPPHSDPLYNEVSNSFFNQVFRKCQLILGILINFSSLSKWNLTENWYLPITISKNTYCLYFRLYFRLFSHSRSLCRDVYILCHKSALTKPFLFGSFLTTR